MAVEARYVGTRARQQWTNYNYNELNIIENGMLDEFKMAQANLQANLAAGRGGNFRYYGPGSGTSPLPNTLAYFSGVPASLAGDPARYSSSLFANSTAPAGPAWPRASGRGRRFAAARPAAPRWRAFSAGLMSIARPSLPPPTPGARTTRSDAGLVHVHPGASWGQHDGVSTRRTPSPRTACARSRLS
jgi:hypothetical protein